MNLDKLEKKFGKYAIDNLTMWIIASYVLGYLLEILSPDLLNLLSLEPAYILQGQVWRILTWIVIPPRNLDFFTIIMLFFYFSIGRSLEANWGKFKYNVYIFSGIILSVIGAIIMFIVLYKGFGVAYSFGNVFTTYYINMSIFLAFAAMFPNMEVRLMMVLPIKIKYLAYLDVILLFVAILSASWPEKIAIIISLLNFIIFFFSTRNFKRITPKEVKRRYSYQREVKNAQGITKHKCAVCGRTEEDGDHLVFRFCSKCNGNFEYCQDHLFTHEHNKKH